MRGARPPPGLPPGGEAATGAPPALASPGRSREAATVRTHAYPNRQIDRQGRAGRRAGTRQDTLTSSQQAGLALSPALTLTLNRRARP